MNLLIPEDRIRTLSVVVIHDGEIPDSFVQGQMIDQCAQELVAKLFEHNKIKTTKREDGKFTHYVSVDIIVPMKD